MIETADDWAVFTDPDVFGEPMELVRAGQGAEAFTGIYTDAHVALADGSVSTVRPVVTVGPLPGGDVRAGDEITARGELFRVTDTQPDGTGQVRVYLERA